MRKLWLLVILVSTRVVPAQENAVSEQLAGCYVLHLADRHPAMSKAENVLPKRFQLTSHPFPYHTDSTGKTFVVRNLDSTIHWDLSRSSWTLTDESSLQIMWSTGYVGYGIHLTSSKGSLVGRAHYWTDTDPLPLDLFSTHNSAAVKVDRVECKDSEK